jgi:transcriptional regulator with XRE-family HTH domain
MQERSSRPFEDELPRLLKQRGMSLRQLAKILEINVSHLSRVTRKQKRVTPELAKRAAVKLNLPPDYFPEVREAYVRERLRRQPGLLDRTYDELRGRSRPS